MSRRSTAFLALLLAAWATGGAADDVMESRIAERVAALDQALRKGPVGYTEPEFENRVHLLTNSITTSGAGSSTYVFRALRDARLLLTTRQTLVEHLANALPYDAAATVNEFLALIEDPREPAVLRDAAALKLASFSMARDRSLAAAAKLLHDTRGERGAVALALLRPTKLSNELMADVRKALAHPDERARLGALQLITALGPAAKKLEPETRRARIDERLMVRQSAEQALAAINARPTPPGALEDKTLKRSNPQP